MPGNVDKWRNDEAEDRLVSVLIRLARAEAQCFRLGRGDVERPEQPVPQGQVDAEVAVVVLGGVAVVNLVLGRTVQHVLHHWPERQPHMAVTQICRQGIEDENQIRHAEQRVATDLPATGVPEDSGIGTDADEGRELFDDLLHEMHPTGRRRHQHRCRMMDFVKGPQPP